MSNYVFSFTQDLQSPMQVREMVSATYTGDSSPIVIRVTVTDGGDPVDLTGQSVTAYCLRADGTTITWQGTVSGGAASVTLSRACFDVPGRLSVIIKISDGSVVTTIYAAVGTVTRTSDTIVVTPTAGVPTVETLMAQVASATAAADAATTDAVAAAAHAEQAAQETEGAVSYAVAQTLDADQQKQGRKNVEAAGRLDIYSNTAQPLGQRDSATTANVNVTVNGGKVTLSGTASSDMLVMFGRTTWGAWTNPSAKAITNRMLNEPDEFITGVPEGHRVLIMMRFISGTVAKGGATYTPATGITTANEALRLYPARAEQTANTSISLENGMGTVVATRTATAGGRGPLCLYVYEGVTYTDAVFEIMSYDIDANNGEISALMEPELRMTARAFSSQNTAYSVGEYVRYGRCLYRCLVATPQGAGWIPERWEQVMVTDLLSANEKKRRTGDYEWFTVTVDRPMAFGGTETTTRTEGVQCVLRLPGSYTAGGTPTRLVLMCHGSTGYVDQANEGWYANGSGWRALCDSLLAAGYALFDSNVITWQGHDTSNVGFAIGSPLYVNVLKKAYDYIQRHYNVYPQIFAHGTSMGGAGASAFSHMYPELVLAESSFAGRDILLYIREMSTNGSSFDDRYALAFGYTDKAAMIADQYSHLDGCAYSLSLLKVGDDGSIVYPPARTGATTQNWLEYYADILGTGRDEDTAVQKCIGRREVPYKCWNSWKDDKDDCYLERVLQRAYQTGSACPYYIVEYPENLNYTHGNMSYGEVDNMRAQLVAWFKRWE